MLEISFHLQYEKKNLFSSAIIIIFWAARRIPFLIKNREFNNSEPIQNQSEKPSVAPAGASAGWESFSVKRGPCMAEIFIEETRKTGKNE